MINLAVINLKTLLKRMVKIIFIILMIAMMFKLTQIVYQKASNRKKIELQTNVSMIKDNLSVSYFFEKNESTKKSEWKKILVAELAIFSGAEEQMMEKENQEEVIEFENLDNQPIPEIATQEPKVEENQSQQAPIVQNENVQTAVIETNNKKDMYTDIYKSVQIKNESNYSLTEQMVTPDVSYGNTKDIIIYHTHTCESYTPLDNSQYVATGNYRTTDLNYSVAKVGTELTNYLAGKGYTVIHDQTYHDYPSYTGSYTRALSTIKNLLSTYSTVDCVLDIHRDALRKQ